MRLQPNGRLVVIPHGAHGFDGLGLGDCLLRMITAFMTRGSARGLDTSCAAAAKCPAFDLQ